MNLFEQTLNNEMDITSDVILNFSWHDKEAYAIWLAQTYNMVNYSTRPVALAGGYCNFENEQLHNRFVDHSQEERGHPIMCIQDLKALKYNYNDLPLTPQSSVLFQIQYYWITQVTPASFFGYSLGLETLAYKFGKRLFEMASSAHGRKATNFLRVHAEDDIEHVETALKEISKLNNFEMESATKNLIICCNTYRDMLKNIEQIVARNKLTQVAS